MSLPNNLPIVPVEVIQDYIIPFCGPEELLLFRLSGSRAMNEGVDSALEARGYPHVIRERRDSTTLFYENSARFPGHYIVNQRQPFVFQVEMADGSIVICHWGLLNELWHEDSNAQMEGCQCNGTIQKTKSVTTFRHPRGYRGFFAHNLEERARILEACAPRFRCMEQNMPTAEYLLQNCDEMIRDHVLPKYLAPPAPDRLSRAMDLDFTYGTNEPRPLGHGAGSLKNSFGSDELEVVYP
jgi:hypothetical protein